MLYRTVFFCFKSWRAVPDTRGLSTGHVISTKHVVNSWQDVTNIPVAWRKKDTVFRTGSKGESRYFVVRVYLRKYHPGSSWCIVYTPENYIRWNLEKSMLQTINFGVHETSVMTWLGQIFKQREFRLVTFEFANGGRYPDITTKIQYVNAGLQKILDFNIYWKQ